MFIYLSPPPQQPQNWGCESHLLQFGGSKWRNWGRRPGQSDTLHRPCSRNAFVDSGLVLSCTSCATLGKFLSLSGLRIQACQMGVGTRGYLGGSGKTCLPHWRGGA
jgi:hypothetical protein